MKSPIHIDQILGLSQKRYFGNGYKQVKHDITNINIDPKTHKFSADISISYPADWSKKETSKELQPHLSTIDAYIVSSQMVEAYISFCQLLDADDRKQSWIRKLSIKAGKSPVNDLNRIAAKGEFENTVANADSLNGNISNFSIVIAGFTIQLELDHGPVKAILNSDAGYFKSINDALKGRKSSYYGGQYKHLHHDIFVNQVNSQQLVSDIVINKERDYQVDNNLGAKYSSYYNPLDILISCAQLCQILMYKIDGLDRTNTKNLWMRSITVFCPKPAIKEGKFPVVVSVDQSKLLEKGKSDWRFADISAKTALDNNCYLEASVAHEVVRVKSTESL